MQEAPLEVQKKAKCIIGEDYPAPIVDHKEISKINIQRLKEAYSKQEGSQAATPPAKSPAKKPKAAATSPAKSPAKKQKEPPASAAKSPTKKQKK